MKTLNAKRIGAAKQAGFTIIELVVVILLLGILTATALPRFLDVTDEAHVAVQEAVLGGLSTGSALFRAGWFASGQLGADISQFGDGTLDPFDAADPDVGYPVGTDGGDVILNSADCLAIFNGLLQSGRPSATSVTFSATPATLETAIEGVATTFDWVATTDEEPNAQVLAGSTSTTQATGCNFYYIGQVRTGTVAAPVTVPFINYKVATGVIGFGAGFAMNQG